MAHLYNYIYYFYSYETPFIFIFLLYFTKLIFIYNMKITFISDTHTYMYDKNYKELILPEGDIFVFLVILCHRVITKEN